MTQPPDVDPALWAEVRQLTDRAHDLANWDADEAGPKPPPVRVTLEIEREWFLLFAWLALRERKQRKGDNGATGWTPDRLSMRDLEPVLRRTVKGWIGWLLNEDFHAQLGDLTAGRSYYLRPAPPQPERQTPGGDLDDGIPF